MFQYLNCRSVHTKSFPTPGIVPSMICSIISVPCIDELLLIIMPRRVVQSQVVIRFCEIITAGVPTMNRLIVN